MQSVCQRFWYQKVSSGPVLVLVGFQFVLVSSGSQRLSEFGCQVLFFF